MDSVNHEDSIEGLIEEVEGGRPIVGEKPRPQALRQQRLETIKEPLQEIDPGLNKDDLSTVLYSEIQRKGIAGDNISSANHLYERGIRDIMTKTFRIEIPYMKNQRDKTDEDKKIDSISLLVEFTDVKLYPPSIINRDTGESSMLTPNMARLRNLTYSAPMEIDATVKATAHLKDGGKIERSEKISGYRVASIPVMLRSSLCHTYRASPETLKALQEDPNNPGGYYIVNGGEWAVDNLESILINGFHVYKNVYQNEVCRGEFISKPGDAYENSFYCILRLLRSGAITIQITFNKKDKFDLPFYLLFRAFGMTRDDEIVDHIVYGRTLGDSVTREMVTILSRALIIADKTFDRLVHVTDPLKIIEVLGSKMLNTEGTAYLRDENATRYVNNATYARLDKYIFPHMGLDGSSRIRKMRFLGHLINTLLRVHLGVLEPTDRDSLKSKRMHGPGVSLAKSFKTQVNFIIVHEIRKHLIKDFKSTPFRAVPLGDSVRAAVNIQDLEKVLTQVITSGNKTITVKRNEVLNRLSSQTVYHKNDLNLKSILNTINSMNSTTSRSKSTDRADQMRRVHSTFVGFISVAQSADTGEKVGVSKQKCPWVTITEASNSEALKMTVSEDPEFIPLDDCPIPSEITTRKLTKVFVNGDWIGLCENGAYFAQYYRWLRRAGKIHPHTTVVWEPLVRNVMLWVDVGRLIRPLLIVYNNIVEYIADYRKHGEKGKVRFTQWIKLRRDHIDDLRSGKILIDTLMSDRVIEYISAEEQENMLVAPSYEYLIKARHDITTQYTHCDIEQAIFGIVDLSAANLNHNPASRICMMGNHTKQACGWSVLNYPHRIDKNVFLQYYCETPMVKSFSTPLIMPNNQNVIMAYACHSGNNQEDSSIVNLSSVQRGLFNGCMFRAEKAELDKGEMWSNPDFAKTVDIRKDCNYGLIENGFVREGSIVRNRDVLIVKTATIAQPTDEYQYVDKSIVYKHVDSAIVERVVVTHNAEDRSIAKIKLRSPRPLGVGDKLCLTPDHMVLVDGRGFIPIGDVTTDDFVYTINKRGDGIYQRPSKVHKYQHDGMVYRCRYAIMTPDHKVLLMGCGTRMMVTAQECTDKIFQQYAVIDSGVFSESTPMDVDMGGWRLPSVDYFETLAALVAYGSIDDTLLVSVDPVAMRWISKNANIKIHQCTDGTGRYIVHGVEKILKDTAMLSRLPLNIECSVSSRVVVDVFFSASGHIRIPKILAESLLVYCVHAGIRAELTDDGIQLLLHPSILGEVTTMEYSGDVHCLTMETGVFLVLHNGKVHFTGNSSRNGNKAIVASLWPAEDMPYDEDGMTPDVIINPHGIPGRMVVGQLIETLQAIYAVNEGVFIESSPFRTIDIKSIMKILEEKYGIRYGGHKRLYNGRWGTWLDTLIFMGPVGYQRLQKFVIDESYSVATGPSSSLERQPLDGRSNEGGLRLGEMENWVLASHGAMRVMSHKLYDHSDGIEMFICKNCGLPAIVNEKLGIFKCKQCKDACDIASVNSSWVANLLFHELNAMNIGLNFECEPYTYTKEMSK